MFHVSWFGSLPPMPNRNLVNGTACPPVDSTATPPSLLHKNRTWWRFAENGNDNNLDLNDLDAWLRRDSHPRPNFLKVPGIPIRTLPVRTAAYSHLAGNSTLKISAFQLPRLIVPGDGKAPCAGNAGQIVSKARHSSRLQC